MECIDHTNGDLHDNEPGNLTIVEVSQESGAWPIRVGGVYGVRNTVNSLCNGPVMDRVTAIDGDNVHTVIVTTYPHGGQEEHDPDCLEAAEFREMHYPEDASPLDLLYSLLERARDVMRAEDCGAVLAAEITEALKQRPRLTHAY